MIHTGEEVVLVAGYAVRGTRYAVSDIYRRGSCLSSWLRGARYAVSDMYKRGSYLSSWVRAVRSK